MESLQRPLTPSPPDCPPSPIFILIAVHLERPAEFIDAVMRFIA